MGEGEGSTERYIQRRLVDLRGELLIRNHKYSFQLNRNGMLGQVSGSVVTAAAAIVGVLVIIRVVGRGSGRWRLGMLAVGCGGWWGCAGRSWSDAAIF